MKRMSIALRAIALGSILTGCAAGALPTSSDPATLTPSATGATDPAADCATDGIDGQYRRAFTADDTSNSDLYGGWTLEIADCRFTISLDGERQGSGRMELVDGTAETGRVALSEDLCPNEFTGEGFYEIALNGDELQIAEAIQATDQCEGRAEAFVTPPMWERDPT